MKTAIITKIESVNGGQIWTVSVKLNGLESFEVDFSELKAGDSFSDGRSRDGTHWFQFYKQPKAQVGDQIDEDGEVIKTAIAGKITEVELHRREPTLEEVWSEKHGLNINL